MSDHRSNIVVSHVWCTENSTWPATLNVQRSTIDDLHFRTCTARVRRRIHMRQSVKLHQRNSRRNPLSSSPQSNQAFSLADVWTFHLSTPLQLSLQGGELQQGMDLVLSLRTSTIRDLDYTPTTFDTWCPVVAPLSACPTQQP